MGRENAETEHDDKTSPDLPLRTGPLVVPSLAPGGNHLILSLVVPTYNERDNVEPLVKQVCEVLDVAAPGSYEIIFVDDHSEDETYKKVREVAASYGQTKLIDRTNERGLATAVIRGWQVASGEILGVIDGDLQHPPQTLVSLLDAIKSGADVAIASRHLHRANIPGLSWLRRRMSQGARLLGFAMIPWVVGRSTDPMSGYFLLKRAVVQGRQLTPVGYKILVEVLARGDAEKIKEVPFIFQKRNSGVTKVSWFHYFEYVWHLIKLRFFLWFGKQH